MTRCTHSKGTRGKTGTRAIAIAIAILVSLSPSALALSFDDCSSGALSDLRRRVWEADHRLRPVIFSRDLLHLEACLGPKASAAQDVQSLLTAGGYELTEVEVSASTNAVQAEAARDACDNMSNCVAEVYVKPGTAAAQGDLQFGASGGLPFAAFLGHLGKAGHFEITGRALREGPFQWSRRATEIVQDASRDADFFEWEHPAAHAQTANTEQGKIGESSAAAQANFFGWVRGNLSRAQSLCQSGEYRLALYMLGYSLHAVQDLAFHEGITNAEHSYWDLEHKVYVDTGERYDEKMALASLASVAVVDWFAGRLHDQTCLSKMVDWPGRGPLSTAEKRKLLHIDHFDFTPRSYFRYRSLSNLLAIALAKTGRTDEHLIKPRWLVAPRRQSLDDMLAKLNDAIAQAPSDALAGSDRRVRP